MQNKWLGSILVSSLLLGAAGCPDIKVDPGEGVNDMPAAGPIIEFDPSNKIVPFPNNLLLNPMTGKVNLPMSCGEGPASKATREGVLNKLDGFGTFETAMTITLTEPVDPTTLAGHVLLYKRASGATAVDPTSAMAIPVVTIASMTTRFDASCMNPVMVPQVIIIPRVPLEQKSTYVVALTAGIKTAMGADYGPSFTWALVRQEAPLVELDASGNVIANNTPLDPRDPGDLASLQGIDLLWKAHAKAMQFLRGTNVATSDVLLAWEFNTQTTTDPLNPAVATSPAAMVSTMPLTGPIDAFTTPIPVTGAAANRAAYPYLACTTAGELSDVQCWLKMTLGGGSACTTQMACDGAYAVGNATCASVGCANIGNVLAGRVHAKQYQTLRDNAAVPAKKIPGPWSDPVTPTLVGEELVTAIIVVPASAAAPTGRQVAIFQHGLGSNKESVFAIAGNLAGIGFATVSIDAVAHGSRAIQNSVEPTLGCAGTPSVATAPQCFAGFLSPDLGATRDNIRQTVLDQQSVIAGLKACGTTACGSFTVDPAHIVYIGISLGGIIGSVTTAVAPDIKAAVLNVPGVGWADIFENTASLAIRCTLVNGLIDAGILMGDKWTGGTTGLCTTDAWKAQAGYRTFAAIGRWVLDPADPANFTMKLAARRILIQEVVNDQVVPNIATNNEGALTGLMAQPATCAPSPPVPPSTAITTMPMMNKFLKYMDLPAGTCDATGTAQAFPGNTFEHASLLRPADGHCTIETTRRCAVTAQCPMSGDTCDALSVGAGRLGTVRLQTDALVFLNANR